MIVLGAGVVDKEHRVPCLFIIMVKNRNGDGIIIKDENGEFYG